MTKFIPIHEAAELLGVSTQTVRRWEKSGKLPPAERTKGGQRRYNPIQLVQSLTFPRCKNKLTLAYARVSCHDQKDDLQR